MNADDEFGASAEETREIVRNYVCRVMAKFPGKTVTSEETPQHADNDYRILVDGKLHHFIEVKTRRSNFGDYTHTKLPLRKHSTAEHYFKALGIRTWFIVKFADGSVCGIDLTREPDKVETQVARYDRGDYEDVFAFYDLEQAFPI